MAREQVNFICSVDGCGAKAHAKGWCRTHWTRMHLYGRLEKIQGIIKGTCTAEGCTNPIKGNGLCNNHYQMQRKYGRTNKIKKPSKTLHPFYYIWHDKKQAKNLCEKWLDFWSFVTDVGERPSSAHVLNKLDESLPYSPDNFKWSETLIREVSETDKEWWARKWDDRRNRNPEEEWDRNLQRKYGITIQKYNEMFWIQNGRCFICNKEENLGKNNKTKRLCVDHCHKSENVRKLLCNRCNVVLGLSDDNVELLQKMIDYLIQHKEL